MVLRGEDRLTEFITLFSLSLDRQENNYRYTINEDSKTSRFGKPWQGESIQDTKLAVPADSVQRTATVKYVKGNKRANCAKR